MPSKSVSLEDLVAGASLKKIQLYRVVGERYLNEQPSGEIDIDPKYGLQLDFPTEGNGFRVLVSIDIETQIGKIGSSAFAEYELPESGLVDGPSDEIFEFVNEISLMHLAPFLRQSIADVTQRVFDRPLLMPILQRGQIRFAFEAKD